MMDNQYKKKKFTNSKNTRMISELASVAEN